MRNEVLAELDEEYPRLSKATENDMLDEPSERDLAGILITLDADTVEELDELQDGGSVKSSIAFSEHLAPAEVSKVLTMLGFSLMRQQSE